MLDYLVGLVCLGWFTTDSYWKDLDAFQANLYVLNIDGIAAFDYNLHQYYIRRALQTNILTRDMMRDPS
jgi:hypothetical protein